MLSAEGLVQLSRAIKDPLKRKIIAKDVTIVGGLVLLLSNPDKKIVIEALDIILSLAAPVENRLFFREFIGMLEQLEVLAKDTNPLDHIRDLASQLISRLHSELPVQQQTYVSQQLKSRSTNVDSSFHHRSTKAFSKPFLNASRFKTVTLQVEGLHDKSDMEVCKEQLLTVKGVVSITFDLSKSRSIVRVKPDISPHTLAVAIQQSNTMVAGQVVRSEFGEERVVELHETRSDNKENADLPGYLSDEDSPVKIDDKAVRRFGAKGDDVNGAGWLGAAASFLAKSFYW